MSNFYSQTNFAFLIDRIVLIFFMLGDNVAKELKLTLIKKLSNTNAFGIIMFLLTQAVST